MGQDDDPMAVLQTAMVALMEQNKLMTQQLAALKDGLVNKPDDKEVKLQKEELARAKREQELKQKWNDLLTQEQALQLEKDQVEMELKTLAQNRMGESSRAAGMFANRGKEERIDLTFGEQVTPAAWKAFTSHYKVVRDINVQEEFIHWDSSSFRAKKIRLALRGEPAQYVTQENSMGQTWTENDDGIIDHLTARYVNTHAIEAQIAEFERSDQSSREPLTEYMSRLQGLVAEGFPGEPQGILDKRVAWRFLNGVRSEKIKEKLLESGWMKNRTEVKPLSDILQVAEAARKIMEAQRATSNKGESTTGTAGAAQFPGQAKAFSCYYCNSSSHGWYKCPKRIEEQPNWEPSEGGSGSRRGKAPRSKKNGGDGKQKRGDGGDSKKGF